MKAPFAPYSDGEANDLSYIHPGLRHLAVPIGSVLLDPANVNTHPAEQIEILKSVLREFGQRLPMITRAATGVLEAGEGRVLAARALGWKRGDVVFDGFGGSGSTLLAAHSLGRRARLVELAPGFCDVIVKQAQGLGLEAVVDRPGVGRIAWGSEGA